MDERPTGLKVIELPDVEEALWGLKFPGTYPTMPARFALDKLGLTRRKPHCESSALSEVEGRIICRIEHGVLQPPRLWRRGDRITFA